jgi:hypothetical protein
MSEDFLKEDIMSEEAVRAERRRALVLQTVVSHAADMGISEALVKFGAGLSDVEKQMLASLTPGELAALRSVSLKLPGFGLRSQIFDDTNNNNCPQSPPTGVLA